MAAKRSRRPARGTILRRWLAVVALVLVGYLYYHPLRTYFSTRHELAARRAEVGALAAQKRELERRLADSKSIESLARQARSLGFVRPGEHLFIVNGIQAFLRARATIARHG